MNNTEKGPRKQNKGLMIGLIALAVLLAIAIAGNIIYMNRSGKLTDEKEQLEALNQSLQLEINELKETIVVKDELIAEHLAAMELLKEEHAATIAEKETRIANLGWRVNTRSKELEEAREENLLLIAEKEEMEHQHKLLSEEMNAMRAEMDELAASHQELLKEAEMNKDMNVYNMCLLTKWDRLICADRYNVSKARRVDHTLINFELDGSTFAETGNKTIHLVMLNPEGMVMYENPDMFRIEETGEEIAFTRMQQVNYTSEPVKVIFDIIHPDKLQAGNYNLMVYVDGKLSRVKEVVLE
jgi:uncharacterized membrane protein